MRANKKSYLFLLTCLGLIRFTWDGRNLIFDGVLIEICLGYYEGAFIILRNFGLGL